MRKTVIIKTAILLIGFCDRDPARILQFYNDFCAVRNIWIWSE